MQRAWTTGAATPPAAGDTLDSGYDLLNHMTVVQRDGSTVATYVYSAFGQRTGNITDTQGLSFEYHENQQQLVEYDGETDRDYIWLDFLS